MLVKCTDSQGPPQIDRIRISRIGSFIGYLCTGTPEILLERAEPDVYTGLELF